MKFKRIFLIVLDSLGVGESVDASNYNDKGANTLGNILKNYDLFIPNLKKLGFLNTLTMNNKESEAYYTIARPKNKVKYLVLLVKIYSPSCSLKGRATTLPTFHSSLLVISLIISAY